MVFLQKCIEVGWRPPKEKGQFDLLPIVVHSPNELPKFFDVSSVCLEVPIRHPECVCEPYCIVLVRVYLYYRTDSRGSMILHLNGTRYLQCQV